MEINAIKSEEDYEETLKIIDQLFDASENTEEAEKLKILSILVEDYENKYYKIDPPDPIEAIKIRAEQLGLTRRDLEKSIGSRGRVADILGKKRNLTLTMIRKLHKNLNIPADILIRESKKNSA